MMGWNVNKLNMKGLSEKASCSLIGESVHLGCTAVVLCSIVYGEGPWWTTRATASSPVVVQKLAAVALKGDPKGSETVVAKRRRTGCMPFPKSARAQD